MCIHQIPLICIWQRGTSGIRAQTLRVHNEKMPGSWTTSSTTYAVAVTEIQFYACLQTRERDDFGRYSLQSFHRRVPEVWRKI